MVRKKRACKNCRMKVIHDLLGGWHIDVIAGHCTAHDLMLIQFATAKHS
jgi:hypothetical protein